MVFLYVDDLLVTGNNSIHVEEFKSTMHKEFEMTDLGEMTCFLGMEIHLSQDDIFICQKKYANEILRKFGMEGCKSVGTPLVQNQRLCKEDEATLVDETKFMSKPCEEHLKAAKRVPRYIKGTTDHGILFKKFENFKLVGYADSDWGGSCNDMRSTSGYVLLLNCGAFCWSSKKQEILAQSTAEAEYISAAAVVNQVI
ncbi:secreted RxLR effector protein 161-like [Pistacia vera]|uniref:secreted RxLR effector protein 161-like n=1 Tax=Pistacia vera TaxID=55513 RepID=UPI001262F2AD|nr:secreted RxLR effector protein 161-like [Pistacia vera]